MHDDLAVPASVIRTFHHAEFDPVELAERKGASRVSVCIPARDEAATIGPIVECVRRDLIDGAGLVHEILVIDDHSSDGTAELATAAGARVVNAETVLPTYGTGHGKGEALWKSVFAAEGDLIVWCDADVLDFHPGYVTGLVGPLVTRPDLCFVKGFYRRPVDNGTDATGGRVTELVARPVLSILFPQLGPVVQPLAGEYAGRRSLLEQLSFVVGYGVDIALLIDAMRVAGEHALAQVDLGTRTHRNRTLAELGPQATSVLQAALDRSGHFGVPEVAVLARPGLDPVYVESASRPPLVSIPEYRRPSA